MISVDQRPGLQAASRHRRSFDNTKPYKHYRWTVIETQTINTCCMQIAEVELLGSTLPPNVIQPGDAIIASSSNIPAPKAWPTPSMAPSQVPEPSIPTKPGRANPPVRGHAFGGRTLVYGIAMQSANDAPERDPKIVTLEGSNDDTVTDFASGTGN